MKTWMNGGDSSTTMWMYFMPLNWTIKKWLGWSILLHVFYHDFKNNFKKVRGCPMSAPHLLLSGVGGGYWEQNPRGRRVICKTAVWGLFPTYPRPLKSIWQDWLTRQRVIEPHNFPRGTRRADWQALRFMLYNHRAASFQTRRGEFRCAPCLWRANWWVIPK